MIDVEALAGEIAFRLDQEALLDAEGAARLLPATLVTL